MIYQECIINTTLDWPPIIDISIDTTVNTQLVLNQQSQCQPRCKMSVNWVLIKMLINGP